LLHITNGDSATERLRQAAVPGQLLPWRDALHEGPVPAGLSLDELRPVRARFIAAQGWPSYEQALQDLAERDAALAGYAAHDEVVLWFEHDLFDQLQLIQLLDWFDGRQPAPSRLSLICEPDYLGRMSPARLQGLFQQRQAVTSQQLALGRRAWGAFRSPDPALLLTLLQTDTAALPFLAAALRRHLQEFPSITNGLSRTEAQALAALAEGPHTVGEVYTAAHHEQEEAIFLGDHVFARCLGRLTQVEQPLMAGPDGGPVAPPRHADRFAGFWTTPVALTEFGEAVLAGREDHVRANGPERWLGGVHLGGGLPDWRWDEAAGQLRAGDS
jgi:hypothetical protein